MTYPDNVTYPNDVTYTDDVTYPVDVSVLAPPIHTMMAGLGQVNTVVQPRVDYPAAGRNEEVDINIRHVSNA